MPAQPRFESDEDLGIGEDAAPDALAALMANPELAKLIDAAVTQRLAQMGSAPSTGVTGEAFDNLAKVLSRAFEVNAMQLPGYQKPLPAEEVERRAAGNIEMRALLADYEAKGTPPLWTIGDNGFFECTNALEFNPGQQIRTYLPPAEDFRPENDEARKVHAAMMQWIGGPTLSIGEQVEAAHIASKLPPLISGALQPDRRVGLVEVVDTAPVARPARRSMGTVVPERRDISMAERAAGPSGPTFVGADAA